MLGKRIAHITLTTGHRRDSYIDDIDAQLFFRMRAMFQDAVKSDGVDFIDDTYLKLIKINEDSYICTLFLKTKKGLCPILTTAGSTVMDADLWAALHDDCFTPVVTDKNKPPTPPFIADRIDVPHPSAARAFTWTGDFSKCLGWMMLFPEDIAKRAIVGEQKKR